MDLRSTILGLLSWKPASGYDLKRIISESEVFYWSGNNNQIYKSLLELQQEGLVIHQVQVQDSLPAKKIYSITEQGLAELHRSLLADPEAPEVHKDFLIQLAWAETLSDEDILALLGKYEAEIANRLGMVQAQAARAAGRAAAQAAAQAADHASDHVSAHASASPGRSPREKYLWRRIAANLIITYQAELDWVRQTQQEFREGKYGE